MKTKIIFIPTWRCQLSCPYCDYRIKGGYLHCFGRKIKLGMERHWMDWIKDLERFDPFLLEMTGGEPTMYNGLENLLASLPKKSEWAMTSNTLNSVDKLPGNNCISWTASYHYHSDKLFLDNCKRLKDKGIPVKITMVITPENFKTVKKKIKFFRKKFLIHIHPVLKKGFDWREYPNIWKDMHKLESKKVKVIKDIDSHWKEKRYKECNAGGYYFMVFPNGRVFRCYSAILGQGDLGYIWDYKPDYKLRECGYPCVFPCDEMPVKKGEIDEEAKVCM